MNSNKSIRILVLSLALAASAITLAGNSSGTPADIQALITRLGLHEAERPVSESTGWRVPRVVLARDPGDEAGRMAGFMPIDPSLRSRSG